MTAFPGYVKAAKAAMFTAYTALFPTSLVTYGPEGTYQPEEIVEVLDFIVVEGQGPSSPLRRRDFDFQATGVITVYRGGGNEIQQTVTERAMDMLDTIAAYHQDSGTQNSLQNNLGGTVLWARMSGFSLHEEEEDIDEGRTTAIEFTVTGRIRA